MNADKAIAFNRRESRPSAFFALFEMFLAPGGIPAFCPMGGVYYY